MQHQFELEPLRQRIFSGVFLAIASSKALLVQGHELAERLLTFGRSAPDFDPVDFDVAVTLEDFHNVVRRVSVFGTGRTITGKVAEDLLGILASYKRVSHPRSKISDTIYLLSPKYAIRPPLGRSKRESKA